MDVSKHDKEAEVNSISFFFFQTFDNCNEKSMLFEDSNGLIFLSTDGVTWIIYESSADTALAMVVRWACRRALLLSYMLVSVSLFFFNTNQHRTFGTHDSVEFHISIHTSSERVKKTHLLFPGAEIFLRQKLHYFHWKRDKHQFSKSNGLIEKENQINYNDNVSFIHTIGCVNFHKFSNRPSRWYPWMRWIY